MTPRLIATDLDGTLVRSDDTVSERSHRILGSLAEQGIVIVGATGRGPRLLPLCQTDVPHARFMAMANGGYVFDLSGPTPQPLRQSLMSGPATAILVTMLEEQAGPLTVIAEPSLSNEAPLLGDAVTDWPWPVPIKSTDRSHALSGDLVKIYLRSNRLSPDELLGVARNTVGPERAEFTEAGIGFVEVCPSGIDKGRGLSLVANYLGIAAAEVLVFGDARNDLPMFDWAGYAVGMADAHPEVKATADEITGSNDEDGVAVVLERLFPHLA